MRGFQLPCIRTDRTVLQLLPPEKACLMARFRTENREHLTQWEPSRSSRFYTEAFWHSHLQTAIHDYYRGASVCFSILDTEESEVLGVCNYTNIVRGTFEACHLGYAIAARHEGKGIMYEALSASNRFIFQEMRLHRIMANYQPRNRRSGELLKRLGFEIEGEARKLLKINGVWEDHILTSLLNPYPPEEGQSSVRTKPGLPM